MTPDHVEQLARELLRDEGVRLTPYRCTAGYLTVLVGYNVDARGWEPLEAILGRPINPKALAFTEGDAQKQVRADIGYFEHRLIAKFAAYTKLDPVRQRAFVNLSFNLGDRLLQFRTAFSRVRLALAQTDKDLQQACWDAVCFHFMDSLWSRQVDDGLGGKKGRADRVCYMLRTGNTPR